MTVSAVVAAGGVVAADSGRRRGRALGDRGWTRVPISDRGSATICTLAVSLLMVSMAGVAVVAGAATIARHQAQSAADLGALAGGVLAVIDPAGACDVAASIVQANGATLRSCRVDGLDAVVSAAVEVTGAPAGIGPAVATARAGPEQAPIADLGQD